MSETADAAADIMVETQVSRPPVTQSKKKAKSKKKEKPTKQNSKPGKNGRAPTEHQQLRPLQVRVLKELAKAKGPLTRAKLYDRLGFKAPSGLNNVLGKNDPKKRAKADKVYPSLLTHGYVQLLELDVDGRIERGYEITASGRKALEKATS